MVAFGLALAALGFAPAVLPLVLVCAMARGFFFSGCTGAFYASLLGVFSPLTRASGIGFVMGVGRVFSALRPAACGMDVHGGRGPGVVSLVFAAGAVLAGLLFAAAPRPASVASQG